MNKPFQRVSRVLKQMNTDGGLDKLFPIRLLDASHGKVHAQMTVSKEHLNRLGGLHGGSICYLIDTLGSLSVASTQEDAFTGVSTDLHSTFVRGVELNQVLNLKATCVGRGRNLAYTTVEIFSKDGQKVAFGSHSKFVGGKATTPQT